MSAFELRIALIVVAVIVIAAIYIWHRANSKDQVTADIQLQEFDAKNELNDIPNFNESDDQELLTDDLRSEFQDVSQELRHETITKRRQEYRETVAPKTIPKSVKQAVEVVDADAKEMLVVLYVVARSPIVFTGPMIEQMMAELELEHGDMQVYHYNVNRFNQKTSMYCVANMLKPGNFELDQMNSFETPGLSLILQLPGPEDGLKALNIMLDHAQRIATFLNGELLDQHRNPLTSQTISACKEQVQLFSLRAEKNLAAG